MARPDPRKIKDEAAQHYDRGRWRKALDGYLTLERLEPAEGTWPQRSGEMHRRLAQPREACEALTRACDIYSRHGFLLKAVAVCKMILEIDPKRTGVEEKLASLHAARFATQRRAGFVPVVTPLPDPPPPEPLDLDSHEVPAPPLEEVTLNRIVPGARKSDQIPSHETSAVYEIPIEDEYEVVIEGPSAAESARDLFPRTPLFSSLGEDKLRLLIHNVALRRLAAGETLFRAGDAADALYVVSSGTVSVMAAGEDGVEVEIRRLGDGAFFGEIALLTDQPRTTTIVAADETELLVIDRATVAALVADSNDVMKVMLRFMRDRLIEILVTTHPLFTPFSGEDRKALADRFLFLEAEKGSVLAEEGTRVTALFVLLAGLVDVDHRGHSSAEMPPGSIIGETSLLTGAPALGTVRARTKVFLLAMPRAVFQEVIMTHPQVLEHLGTLADNRRRQSQLWKQV